MSDRSDQPPRSSPGGRADGEPKFYFEGFSRPRYTNVPDDVFDVLMPELTDPELRALLYIIRRTFGFKKDSDDISLKQMVEGIRTRDGRVLDGGAGMSKASAARGLRGLAEKGIILATRNSSRERGDEPTSYELRFRDGKQSQGPDRPVSQSETPPLSQAETPPVSKFETPPRLRQRHPRVSHRDTQETVLQETVLQPLEASKGKATAEERRSEGRATSNGSAVSQAQLPTGNQAGMTSVGDSLAARYGSRGGRPREYDEDRQVILSFIQDLAQKLNDKAPLQSSVTRARNLYEESGLSRSAFLDRLHQAAAITAERSANIHATDEDNGRSFPRKQKMGYFFAVLEDRLGLKESSEGRRP